MQLYNGVEIPLIGFGPGAVSHSHHALFGKTWDRIERLKYINLIAKAISSGFRLIDFSCAYGRCKDIAKSIEKSGVSRQDIFLTGRISNHAQLHGCVNHEIEQVLNGYQTDYVDLLMFHWPVSDHYENTWREICKAYDSGKARSIGVANCHPHHIRKLMECGMKPMVNQFEVHPLFTQKDLVKFNQDIGIVVEAYTPIARFDDRLTRLPALRQIATANGRTLAQVILRWHIQNGCIPVVRSMNEMRQRENLKVFDFKLSSTEMKTIDGFNIDSRLRYHPDNCDFTIL